MIAKDVLLLLTDDWADWEAAYAIAEVNSLPQYTVKTIALDKNSKTSIGGLKAEIDLTIVEYIDFSQLALVILPGGFSWKEHRYEEIANFIKSVLEQKIPVAAICGATIFLGSHGFLDQVKHTGDSFHYFEETKGYHGKKSFFRSSSSERW